MSTGIIIAIAAGIQAAFTVVLVIVYVRKQTGIMEAQRAVFALQLYFNSIWNKHLFQRTFADEFIKKCEEDQNLERLYDLALDLNMDTRTRQK